MKTSSASCLRCSRKEGPELSVYTRQDLSVMQAWPLERKIQVTQAKILEWYYHYGGKVAVSFSGGGDNE